MTFPRSDCLSDCLIVFTRYPQPGLTKTRLIPKLGAQGAARLQQSMTEYLLATIRNLQQYQHLRVEIHFAGGSLPQMQDWLGSNWIYRAQADGELGDRLAWAHRQAVQAGSQRTLIIGSDCPSLRLEQLSQAFQLLQQNDLVLGPAEDGGYYLIGLGQYQPALFRQIDWGTERVLQQTSAIAHRLNLTTAYLESLPDIDRPEDLPVWHRLCA